MSDNVQLPRWIWNDEARALLPRCPNCGASTVVSGMFLTCHMAGYSHFHQPFGDVLRVTQQKLDA